MRPPRPLLLILLLALAGPAAGAPADGDKPRPRRKPPAAKPLEGDALRPSRSAAPPPTIAPLSPPIQPGGGFVSRDISAGGLASGGLRSTLPVIGDRGAQCRTDCVRRRIACESQDAAPECASQWAMCVARCNR